MTNIYSGPEAVSIVESAEGPLSPTERRIVELEGYSPNTYQDTKGINTVGVGQTGPYANMSFKDTVAKFEADTRNMIPNFNSLTPELQTELVQAAYRGDLQRSPNTRHLINSGDYAGAAQEFLANDEYENTQYSGVRTRMEDLSNALQHESLQATPQAAPLSTGEKKQEVLKQVKEPKQELIKEKTARKQLELAGLETQQADMLEQGFEAYVTTGDPLRMGERAMEFQAAESALKDAQYKVAANKKNQEDPLFDVDTKGGYVGNTLLSTLNTVLNIGGGLASMPATLLATAGMTGVTDEDLKTFQGIITKKAAGITLSEEENTFMQKGGRTSSSLVGQLQQGGYVEEEGVSVGESKYSQIERALSSAKVAKLIQDIAGVLDAKVNRELTDEVVGTAANEYNKWDAGEQNFGEMLLGLGETALTSPGATAQAAVESLPYIFLAATPVGAASSIASLWSTKQVDAIEAYEEEYGERPTGDDLLNLTLLAGASAGVDMVGDRLVGGEVLQSLMKGVTLSGKASAVAGRIGLSAVGEFTAESTAAATEELAGTAGKGDVDVGRAVGAGTLGAMAGGATTGTLETAVAGLGAADKVKEAQKAKEISTDSVTQEFAEASTEEERATIIESQEEALKEFDKTTVGEFQKRIDKVDDTDGTALTALKEEAESIRAQRKVITDNIKSMKEAPAIGATSLSQHTNNKVSEVLGSIERGEQGATPAQIERILNNTGISLTPQQRTALEGYAKTEKIRKSMGEVSKEVIEGGNGNKGVDQWLKEGKEAIIAGDAEALATAVEGIRSFRSTHGTPLKTGIAADGSKLGPVLRRRKTKEQEYMDAAINELEGLGIAQGVTKNTEEITNDITEPAAASNVVTPDVDVNKEGKIDGNRDTTSTNIDSGNTPLDTPTVAEQPATEAVAEEATVAEASETTKTKSYTNIEAANAVDDAVANLKLEDSINNSPGYSDGAIKVLRSLQTRIANDEEATIDSVLEILEEAFTPKEIAGARSAMQNTPLPYIPGATINPVGEVSTEEGIAVEDQVAQETETLPEGEMLKDTLVGTPTGAVRSVQDVANYQPRLRNMLANAGITKENMAEAFDRVTELLNEGNPLRNTLRQVVPEYTGKPFKSNKGKIKELASDINALDRADRQAKEAKPVTEEFLRSVNWVKEFFTAKSGVKNILQVKTEVFKANTTSKITDFLGRSLTGAEQTQVKNMTSMVNGLKQMFDSIYNVEYFEKNANTPQYQDLLSYLVDEEGNVYESVKDAIAVAGYNWILDGAQNTVFNDKEAIKSILNHTADTPVENIVADKLRDVGQTEGAVVASLGANVRSILGISQVRTAQEGLNSKLDSALGLMALYSLRKANMVSITSAAALKLNIELIKGRYPGTNITKGTQFVRARPAKIAEGDTYAYDLHPRLQAEVDVNKAARESTPEGEDRMLEGMFALESRRLMPSFTKPKGIISKVRKVTKVLPDSLIPKVLKQNQREHYTKEDNLSVLDALGEYTLRALGEVDPATVHISQRQGVESANKDIQRSIDNLNEFRDMQRAQEGGVKAPFFFNLVPWKNGRWGLAENAVNAQTDKIQRGFISQKGWNITVDPRKDTEVMEQFWASMDEHLNVSSLEDLTPTMHEAISHLIDFLDNNNAFPEGRTAEFADIMAELSAELGSPTLVLDDLLHIAKYMRALSGEPGTTFESTKFVEIDGKTNGMAITLLQYGALPSELMQAFGYYTEAHGYKSYADYKKAGGQDVYSKLASKWQLIFRGQFMGGSAPHLQKLIKGKFSASVTQEQINQILEQAEEVYGGDPEIMADLRKMEAGKVITGKATRWVGDLVYPNKYSPAAAGTIQSILGLSDEKTGKIKPGNWRDIAKSPLMVIFYGSGLPAVTSKVQAEFISKMYDKITELGRDNDVAGYNKLVGELNALIPKWLHLDTLSADSTGSEILAAVIPKKTEQGLYDSIQSFGDSAGRAVTQMFPEYMAHKREVVKASDAMYRMQYHLREKMLAVATKEAIKSGVIATRTSGGFTRKDGSVSPAKTVQINGLPEYIVKEVDARLAKVAPHLFSNKSKGEGIETSLDLSKMRGKTNSNLRTIVNLKNAKTASAKASGLTDVPAAPGVGIVGVGVHNLDSEDQIESMGRDIDKSGVHDAILVGLSDATQGGLELNEDHFNTMKNNNIPESVADALEESIDEFFIISKELGLDPVKEIGVIETTLLEGDKESMMEKGSSIAGVKDSVRALANASTVRKDKILASIKYVNQYADHNGVSSYEVNKAKSDEVIKAENTVNPVASAAKEVIKSEDVQTESDVTVDSALEDTSIRDQLRSRRGNKHKLTAEQIRVRLQNIVNTWGNRSERGSLSAALLRGLDNTDVTFVFPLGTTEANWLTPLSKMVEPKNPTARQRDLHQRAIQGEILGSVVEGDFSTNPADFNSSQAGIDSTNVLDVFNLLPETEGVTENVNHKHYLANMVHTLAAKLTTPFTMHMRDVAGVSTYGHQTGSDVFITRMMDGSPVTSGMLAQGVRMSTHEVMSHELNHVVFAEGFKKDSRYRRQIERMFKAVERAGSYEVLLDDPATATQAEIEGAQTTWNYIFSNKDGNHLAEFGAFATTNEKLMGFVNTVKVAPDRWIQGETAYDRIVNVLNRIIDIFNLAITGLTKSSNTDQLMGLMSRMNDISTGKEVGIMKISDGLVGLSGKAADALQYVGDKAVTGLATAIKPIPYVGAVGRLVSANINQRRKDAAVKGAVKALNNVRDDLMGTKYSILESVVDEASGRTDNNAKAFDLRRKVGLILDGQRKRTKDSYIRNAREGFSVKVSEAEWDSMNKILLKLDIDSISQLGMENIGKVLGNAKVLQNQIDLLEAQLAGSPHRNWMIRQAKNLGHMMNTNESLEEVALLNAYNIVNGHGNDNMNVTPNQAAQYEVVVDRLATLYGIKAASAKHRAEIADLITRDPEGVQNIVFTHAHLKEASKSQFNSIEEYKVLNIKGWTKEVMASGADVIAGTVADHAHLTSLGYVKGNRIPFDTADPTNSVPRWLYVSRDGAMDEYMAQIVSLTNNVAKGADTLATNIQYGSVAPHSAGEVDTLVITGKKQRAMRQMNVTDQTPVRNAWFNAMVPIISPKTKKITGWRYLMSESTKDNQLGKDNNAARVLGAMGANIVDKVNTPKVNREAVEVLKEYYDKEYSQRSKAYVVIGPESKGKYGEIYAQMPTEMHEDIKEVFGGPSLYIRKDLVNQFFGSRAPSLASILEQSPESRKAWERILVMIMKGLTLNKNTYTRIIKAENFFMGLTSEVKSRIVVQSIVVPVFNVFSNAMWLVAQGANPITVFPKMLKAMMDSNRLGGDLRQKGQLEIEVNKPGNTPARQRNLEGKLSLIQARIESNPVFPSYNAGLMPSIVDDVATDLESDSSARGAVHRGISSSIDRVLNPEAFWTNAVGQTVKSIIGTQDSVYVKTMNNFVMNTDFVGRHVYAEMAMKTKSKELGRELSIAEENEIYGTAEDTFVSFGQPTHQSLEYLNRIGVAWFTKYMLRNTGTVAKTIAREPRKMVMRLAMMQLAMADVLTDTPIGSAVPFRNPLTVIDDPLTAALDATSLWAPLQAIN